MYPTHILRFGPRLSVIFDVTSDGTITSAGSGGEQHTMGRIWRRESFGDQAWNFRRTEYPPPLAAPIRQELRDERDSSCRDHFTEVCKLVFGQTTSAEKSIASISKSRSGGTVLVNGGHPENKNGLQ
ncbi:hypothetical protein Plhal304r1_c049g0130941 [Plasmopara halstedii]